MAPLACVKWMPQNKCVIQTLWFNAWSGRCESEKGCAIVVTVLVPRVLLEVMSLPPSSVSVFDSSNSPEWYLVYSCTCTRLSCLSLLLLAGQAFTYKDENQLRAPFSLQDIAFSHFVSFIAVLFNLMSLSLSWLVRVSFSLVWIQLWWVHDATCRKCHCFWGNFQCSPCRALDTACALQPLPHMQTFSIQSPL